MATGPENAEVSRRIEPLEWRRSFDDGGWRVAGHVGAAISPLPRPLRRGWGSWVARSAFGQDFDASGVPAEAIEEMLELYRHRYLGWNVKHFHEHLLRDHHFSWGHTFIKTQLHAAGLVGRAKRRGAHRRKRERKPCEGMMLHQDGSRHAWLEGQPMLDLIVTMDDATSTLYSAFLIEEEGTASSFQGLLETFVTKGLPSSFYTDRGSHYFVTLKAGEAVDKSRLTQVGRALRQLGIEHIPAYSPEARGRSERMFSTLQGRLPKELALAGIADIQAANHFIAQTYLPAHNARFARPPRSRTAPLSPPTRNNWPRYCASRRSASWPATTRSPSRACDYSCRRARSGITSSKPRSRSGSTRMARSQSSTGRAASLDTCPTASQSKTLAPSGKPREPLRRKLKRTSDVLLKPDNLISYRQPRLGVGAKSPAQLQAAIPGNQPVNGIEPTIAQRRRRSPQKPIGQGRRDVSALILNNRQQISFQAKPAQ